MRRASGASACRLTVAVAAVRSAVSRPASMMASGRPSCSSKTATRPKWVLCPAPAPGASKTETSLAASPSPGTWAGMQPSNPVGARAAMRGGAETVPRLIATRAIRTAASSLGEVESRSGVGAVEDEDR